MAYAAEQTQEEYTLYVTNMPYELNEEGLLEIFNYYGTVKSHFSRGNWAYITYNTYRDAESAIRDLNGVPPLRMKVSFGKRLKDDVGYNNISIPVTEKEPDVQSTKNVTTPNKSMTSTMERTKPSDVVNTLESNSGMLKPIAEQNRLPNGICKDADPYQCSNTLWTRGQYTVTPDGKRHVSLGRGYSTYEIPEPIPEIADHFNKVYEKRIFGLYEYGKDELQDKVGKCRVCSKLSKFFCERCHVFYCTKNCQVTDWPTHKIDCEAIPALVTAANFIPVELQQSKQEQTAIRSKRINDYSHPRPPHKLIESLKISNGNCAESNGSRNPELKSDVADVANNLRAKIAKQKTTRAQDVLKKASVTPEREPNPLVEKPLDRQIVNNDSPKSLNNSKNDWEKTEKEICTFTKNKDKITKINEEREFLSDSKFTDVKIVVSMNREYWVQKVEDENDLQQLMVNLQEKAAMAQKVTPTIGCIYAAKYEHLWHRAVVKSIDPIIVHYIDYGNDEILDSDDFREIHELTFTRRFAAKIRLTKDAYDVLKNLNYDDVISVKPTSIDPDKTINVIVQGENNASTLNNGKTDKETHDVRFTPKTNNKTADTKATTTPITALDTPTVIIQLKSVVNTVDIGAIGVLDVHRKIENNTYGITFLPNNAVVDYAQLLNDLPMKCAEVAQNSDHKPNVGDFVCGLRSGNECDWLRGYALSSSEIAVIEETGFAKIDKTVACPKEYLNICAFGVLCELVDNKHELIEKEQYEFKVTARLNQDTIEIDILHGKNTMKANIKVWTPNLKNARKSDSSNKALQFSELRSGDKVVISTYRSPVHYFVRSLGSEEVEYYCRIMRDVGICAQKAPPLKDMPTVGQMVLAQYDDDNFYRAIVTKVQDENITISYIDYGNIQVTHIKKLKVISDDLKQLRCCSSKIILKDVPSDIPLTKEANEYLSVLVGNEVPLTCKFDGVPSKDGVYLERSNGESVNKHINELIMPASKKTVDDNMCYTSTDLVTVPLGNAGDTIHALTLYNINDGYQYAMCPFDSELIVHVYEVMPKMIAEYCEANEYYIPRDKELCLAAYLNGWYRAACITRNHTSTSSAIFFIDFGNTEIVSHKNIRRMPKDFITPDAMANICNVINVAPTDSEGRYPPDVEEKIKKCIIPESTVKIKIVRFDEKTGQYYVELPLIS